MSALEDVTAHGWYCAIDGRPWDDSEHRRRLRLTGGEYRGIPGHIDAWDQWCRENLPNGPQGGIVCCADDGILRSFDPANPKDMGVWCKVEAKSHGKEAGWADRQTLHAIKGGAPLHPLLITYNGAVPTALYHWPAPCPCCGMPGPVPQPSTIVRVQVMVKGRPHVTKLNPEALRGHLLRYLAHQSEVS